MGIHLKFFIAVKVAVIREQPGIEEHQFRVGDVVES